MMDRQLWKKFHKQKDLDAAGKADQKKVGKKFHRITLWKKFHRV